MPSGWSCRIPGRFLLQPKAYALYDFNGKPGKATMKVLDKVDKTNGTATLRGE
jgi:hypothetical protein